MWDLIDEKLAEKQGKKKGEVIDYYVNQLTALGRTSTPEDVAKLVSFLGSSDSNFVTGMFRPHVFTGNAVLIAMQVKLKSSMAASFSPKRIVACQDE